MVASPLTLPCRRRQQRTWGEGGELLRRGSGPTAASRDVTGFGNTTDGGDAVREDVVCDSTGVAMEASHPPALVDRIARKGLKLVLCGLNLAGMST